MRSLTISSSKQASSLKQTKLKPKIVNYLELSNQQFLRRNLMLLGVNQTTFIKETKYSFDAEFFPNHLVNPTSSKQFFYITYVCLQKLASNQQLAPVQIWYPPRTVNQQLQYKKSFFKVIQNLQISGKVPKNMIISKGIIMGDSSASSLVQFLRFLSQMALRHQYLQKFSPKEKLIQVCCNLTTNVSENNINKFYIYPFVPSNTTSSFQHSGLDLNNMKQIYAHYLKIYLKRLVKLRTKNINPILAQPHQELMKKYIEQKQLNETLTQKIPAALLSQNRAFDRRRIIDKNLQIWKQLNQLELNYAEQKQVSTLKLQGEVDKILKKWQPVKGISNIVEANSILKDVEKHKKIINQHCFKFRQLCQKIQSQVKN